MATFNLITQPWIPVREGNTLKLVSLEQALLEARHFTRIEDPSPLVTAALHRLLLAILHRALQGPADAHEAAKWLKDGFDAGKIRNYLTKYHDRFDLFHPDKPFYQVPDFTLERSSRSWTVLAPELNSDNNKVLFDHSVTSRPRPLHPDEAARLLIANQTFALSAGKSVLCHTATAPVATAALVIVLGENLHQTLCLNLVSYPESEYKRDVATWEGEPLRVSDLENCEAAKDTAKGIVHRYTWLSRTVRLEPETDDTQTNDPLSGQSAHVPVHQTVVRWIAYASGIRYEEAAIRPDPMVAFRADPKDPSKQYPLGFREGRALWRDLASLLPRPGSAHSLGVVDHARNVYRALGAQFKGQGIPVMVAGQASMQAKVEFWRGEIYQLPRAILSNLDVWTFINESLSAAETTGERLRKATINLWVELWPVTGDNPEKEREKLKQILEGKPSEKEGGEVKKLRLKVNKSLIPYWSGMEAYFADWIQHLDLTFEEHQSHLEKAWLETLKREALRAWKLTALTAGDDARALRAIHRSEGILLAHIYKERKEVMGAKGN